MMQVVTTQWFANCSPSASSSEQLRAVGYFSQKRRSSEHLSNCSLLGLLAPLVLLALLGGQRGVMVSA